GVPALPHEPYPTRLGSRFAWSTFRGQGQDHYSRACGRLYGARVPARLSFVKHLIPSLHLGSVHEPPRTPPRTLLLRPQGCGRLVGHATLLESPRVNKMDSSYTTPRSVELRCSTRNFPVQRPAATPSFGPFPSRPRSVQCRPRSHRCPRNPAPSQRQ